MPENRWNDGDAETEKSEYDKDLMKLKDGMMMNDEDAEIEKRSKQNNRRKKKKLFFLSYTKQFYNLLRCTV